MLAQADCFHIPLASKSVHCVVTSPPYWGLRRYAGEQGQEPLGLEPTPERHIERTVEWAREVWRVLRSDGVFWLNYGDCYHGSGGENGNLGLGLDTAEQHGNYRKNPRKKTIAGGNLTMMPHRVALALQADGWIVRQDLVWSKPNPMPEPANGWRWQRTRTERERVRGAGVQRSNTASREAGFSGSLDKVEWEYGPDYELRRGSWRHTRAHEYVFQLCKSMQYWSDGEAVRERVGQTAIVEGANGARYSGSRNPRSVLHIPTAPYRGAHYATYPPALIAPLILATCPRWCCPVCGQGWAPVVEQTAEYTAFAKRDMESGGWTKRSGTDTIGRGTAGDGTNSAEVPPKNTVLGHRPTCDCNPSHEFREASYHCSNCDMTIGEAVALKSDYCSVPGIVCDPFVGSGTTVMVARQLLRRGIGFDLSRPYLDEQAKVRTGSGMPSTGLDNLPLFRDTE